MVSISITDYFTVVYFLVIIFTAIQFLVKFHKYRNINLLLIGLAWFGMALPYIPEVLFVFLYYSKIKIDSDVLFFIYFLFNLAIIPIFVFFWLLAFTSLLELGQKSRWLILILYLIYSAFYEILLLSSYIADKSSVGTMDGIALGHWTLLYNLLLFSFIIIILISGLLFAGKAIFKSGSQEIKLKGKILLIAFITFSIGAAIDVMSTDILVVVIARSLMILSSFLFFIGYTLPEWIKNIFLSNK